jgi:flagellar biosynthesis repressor protein FlbT
MTLAHWRRGGGLMALKVELKPGERIFIGESVITNDDQRTRLLINGAAPVLREKDIMTAERAVTPAKRIYLAVQLMYTSRDPRIHHDVYFALIRDIVQAAPSTWPYVESINNHILRGELYKALKQSRKLIEYEEELFRNATRRSSLQKRGKGNIERA